MKRENIHIRDPFVYVEDETYYLLGTTGDDPWGRASDLTLYISKDLHNYEKKCTMVTDNSLDSYTNLWAPELHKYKERYYLIISVYRDDLGRGSLILTSDSLDKPFTMLTGEYITPAGWRCLDATMFVYEEIPYLCFSNEWNDPVSVEDGGSLYIARLSDDLTHLMDDPHLIVSGRKTPGSLLVGDAVKGYVAEGPWLYEDAGKIILLWSGFTESGYSIFKNVSTTGIYGEYVNEKILFDRDGGHCMRFTDLNGKHWITLHQPNITPDERMVLLSVEE